MIKYTPVEFGISLNFTWMSLNNIKDIDVYFKDPINNVNFVTPKVFKKCLQSNLMIFFSSK